MCTFYLSIKSLCLLISSLGLHTLSWNFSFGTPLFKGHLYSGDTYIQGTPLFKGQLFSRDTSIPGTPLFKGHLYSGDTSIQGTPAFRGHKIWSQKSAHIIFEFITSIEGTPLLRGNGHFFWVSKPGCMKLPLNFPLNFSDSLYMERHLI